MVVTIPSSKTLKVVKKPIQIVISKEVKNLKGRDPAVNPTPTKGSKVKPKIVVSIPKNKSKKR